MPNAQPLMPPLPPGSTIGILGGGQLGRMLAIAAAELGYRAHIYCPEADCPASEVAYATTIAGYSDISAITQFGRSVDAVTYEFENVPAASVAALASLAPVRPGPDILAVSQHRVTEKQMLQWLGIETAPFMPVTDEASLRQAVHILGFPAVLKTARMGYDGKGQFLLRHADDLTAVIPALRGELGLHDPLPEIPAQGGDDGEAGFILERFVPFQLEISVIVARGIDGRMLCYCPVQNRHKDHILAETIAPAPITAEIAAEAERIAITIAEALNLVGLLAVEMFVARPLSPPQAGGIKGGRLLVNELAPRPHNSGHWTLDACVTNQFEQTIRAICGLPLGSTARLCDARMLNLIGDDINDWPRYAAMPNAKLHLYGKKEARPGRKMGHVTFLK